MKKILSFLFAFLVLFCTVSVFAQACDSSVCTSGDLNEHLKCINDVKNKCVEQLQNTQSQERTLKSQLAIIDGQSRVTSLKIEETNLKIEKL